MLDDLRGESSVADVCHREGIAESLHYSWSKESLEVGRRRLAGDTARANTSNEVKDLRREPTLKKLVAELGLDKAVLEDVLAKSSPARAHEGSGEIRDGVSRQYRAAGLSIDTPAPIDPAQGKHKESADRDPAAGPWKGK